MTRNQDPAPTLPPICLPPISFCSSRARGVRKTSWTCWLCGRSSRAKAAGNRPRRGIVPVFTCVRSDRMQCSSRSVWSAVSLLPLSGAPAQSEAATRTSNYCNRLSGFGFQHSFGLRISCGMSDAPGAHQPHASTCPCRQPVVAGLARLPARCEWSINGSLRRLDWK